MPERLDPNWPVWSQTRDLIERQVQKVSFSTWIEPIIPYALDAQELYLLMPNFYVRNFVEGKYAALIESALTQISGKTYKLHFLTPEDSHTVSLEEKREELEPVNPSPSLMLNPKYTFDNFVIGNSNRFAHAAALAVAEAPAQAYNPLFIYGGVGLGKTHLLHAIGQFIRESNPKSKILYVSSEKFTYELIAAIHTNTQAAFRARYRSVDVLMIDDIQFIAAKDATQEELFHTFNELHDANKQIIFSSDKPPKELKSMEERLRSRFEWGLIADIQPPDLETRIAILIKKAEAEGWINPNPDVLEFIATHSENNIRELEGALTRTLAYARVSGAPLDVSCAQEALKDLLNQSAGKRATPENILKIVATWYGLTPDDLMARKRSAEIVQPRMVAMYLTRELTDLSLTAIGEFYGRDHTTVHHAYKTISEDYAADAELRSLIASIRNQLNA